MILVLQIGLDLGEDEDEGYSGFHNGLLLTLMGGVVSRLQSGGDQDRKLQRHFSMCLKSLENSRERKDIKGNKKSRVMLIHFSQLSSKELRDGLPCEIGKAEGEGLTQQYLVNHKQ